MKYGYIHNIVRPVSVLLASMFVMAGCSVREYPEAPDYVSLHVRLCYETDMTEWEHVYDGSSVSEQGTGETYDNALDYGKIRYIIRAYPMTDGETSQEYTLEYSITKDISEGYDYGVTFDLDPGDYKIMVWSDLVEQSGDDPYYDADNFSRVTLSGDYEGNTDYRDAFRGSETVSLVASILESPPDTLDITMARPLAKFEFISTDLAEFINEQLMGLQESDGNKSGGADTKVSADDYKAVIYYSSYMPDTYSISADKTVDSSTGVMFESELERLSDSEASVGFDYVFVNTTETTVAIRIGIYDSDGTQLSLTNSIAVPVKRSCHTVLRGKFMTEEASGGVSINHEYDGDHNVYVE